MIEKIRRILVSRTDRIGDLVLTLPVFTALREHLKDVYIAAHVRSYTAPLLVGRPDVDEILADDVNGRRSPILDLARKIKALRIDAAVLVHPSWRAIMGCTLAGIPTRIGRASNVWQVFLTHRAVQHRSKNEKHEAMYNLELLNYLDIHVPDMLPQILPKLYICDDIKSWAAARLAAAGISKPPVFIHPGHGGSADNLPIEKYAELANKLLEVGRSVVVTLGPDELSLQKIFGDYKTGSFALISDAPDVAHLAALLALGSGFAGGSTGPTHLAAAIGLPTVAFFPRKASMTPLRWGPLGPDVHVLMPPEEVGDAPDAMSEINMDVALDILQNKEKIEGINL